jgi:CRP/FNR family cyclic AMP-dependent transcriptional regulator
MDNEIVAPLSPQRQAMNTPVLTIDERHNIEAGAWFSKLSQTLKSAILARAVVRRLADGAPLASRGSTAENGAAWRAARCVSVRFRCRASR